MATARAPPADAVDGAAASGRGGLAAAFLRVWWWYWGGGKVEKAVNKMSPSVGRALLQSSFAAPEAAVPAKGWGPLRPSHPSSSGAQAARILKTTWSGRLLCAPLGRGRTPVEGGRAVFWLAWILSPPRAFFLLNRSSFSEATSLESGENWKLAVADLTNTTTRAGELVVKPEPKAGSLVQQ